MTIVEFSKDVQINVSSHRLESNSTKFYLNRIVETKILIY